MKLSNWLRSLMINYKDKTISLNKNQILTLIKEGKITVRSGFDLQPNIILKVKRTRMYGNLKVTCIGASSRKYLTLKLIKEEQILKNDLLLLIDKEIKELSDTPLKYNHEDNYDFGLEVGEREGALNAYEKLKNIIENK